MIAYRLQTKQKGIILSDNVTQVKHTIWCEQTKKQQRHEKRLLIKKLYLVALSKLLCQLKYELYHPLKSEVVKMKNGRRKITLC